MNLNEARGVLLEAQAYIGKAASLAERILTETKPTDELYAVRKASRYIISGAMTGDTLARRLEERASHDNVGWIERG